MAGTAYAALINDATFVGPLGFPKLEAIVIGMNTNATAANRMMSRRTPSGVGARRSKKKSSMYSRTASAIAANVSSMSSSRSGAISTCFAYRVSTNWPDREVVSKKRCQFL